MITTPLLSHLHHLPTYLQTHNLSALLNKESNCIIEIILVQKLHTKSQLLVTKGTSHSN